MPMPHEIQHQIDIQVPPSVAYQAYADVARWSEWDPDTRAAALEGPPVAGTDGWLQPRKGLRVRMRVTEARPGEVFTVVCPVLGSRMRFAHRIEALADRVRVTHHVRFEGWLAPVLAATVGRDVQKGLPVTLQRLKHHLEQGSGAGG